MIIIITKIIVFLIISAIWGYFADLRKGNIKGFIVRLIVATAIGYVISFVIFRN